MPDTQQPTSPAPEPRTPDPESVYAQLGGDQAVRQLVDAFYALMEHTPQFQEIRAMHPADLQDSADKLYWFLSGWLGGPDLYVERKGHPMLRRRHLPFSIGEAARDQWVACMLLAMEAQQVPAPLRERLLHSFWNTADFMRNRDGA